MIEVLPFYTALPNERVRCKASKRILFPQYLELLMETPPYFVFVGYVAIRPQRAFVYQPKFHSCAPRVRNAG